MVLLAIGLIFILVFARRLLPSPSPTHGGNALPSARELWRRYGLGDQLYELELLPDSPLAGHTIADHSIRTRFSLMILAVRSRARRAEHLSQPKGGPTARELTSAERAHADRTLHAHDQLTVQGAPEAVTRFIKEMKLRELGRPSSLPTRLVIAEVLIPPDSTFLAKTIAETKLRTRFDVSVLAVYRRCW